MTTKDVIQAWKDPEHRAGLSEQQLAALPAHPAGAVELPDAELDGVLGAGTTAWDCSWSFLGSCGAGTWGCC